MKHGIVETNEQLEAISKMVKVSQIAFCPARVFLRQALVSRKGFLMAEMGDAWLTH